MYGQKQHFFEYQKALMNFRKAVDALIF